MKGPLMYLGEKISRRLGWRLLQGPSLLHSQQSVAAALWKRSPVAPGVAFLPRSAGPLGGGPWCPALALSISSPCHVPSVFSPALRFLCLMSHLYILQVVCLAFISPISAFLEGWRGGAGGGCVSVLPTACSSPAADTELPGQILLGVCGVSLTPWLQEAPPEHQCSPASPTHHALGQPIFPPSQGIPDPASKGGINVGQRGPPQLGTPLSHSTSQNAEG